MTNSEKIDALIEGQVESRTNIKHIMKQLDEHVEQTNKRLGALENQPRKTLNYAVQALFQIGFAAFFSYIFNRTNL